MSRCDPRPHHLTGNGVRPLRSEAACCADQAPSRSSSRRAPSLPAGEAATTHGLEGAIAGPGRPGTSHLSSHANGVLDGDWRHPVARSANGDQTSESQPEAVEDNPPRAPTAQHPTRITLKTAACLSLGSAEGAVIQASRGCAPRQQRVSRCSVAWQGVSVVQHAVWPPSTGRADSEQEARPGAAEPGRLPPFRPPGQGVRSAGWRWLRLGPVAVGECARRRRSRHRGATNRRRCVGVGDRDVLRRPALGRESRRSPSRPRRWPRRESALRRPPSWSAPSGSRSRGGRARRDAPSRWRTAGQ